MSDNPSAFPVNAANLGGPGAYEPDPGMSLRDYFAARALAWAGGNEWFSPEAERVAARAYKMADAMLAERAKAFAK